MPSIKSLALVAALATSAVAYYAPIEARSDLDFAPEDLEVLFAREAELDDFVDELELAARELDITPEDLEVLFARDPKFLSSALKLGEKALSHVSHSSHGSEGGSSSKGSKLSKLAHGAESLFNSGMNVGNQYQQYKGQQLQNKNMQIQNQQMQQGGYPGAQQGGYYKRDLYDSFDFEERDLFEEEDPEMWY